MNIYPYSGEELELLNLHFGNKSFDVKMMGSGKNIKEVILNGKSIGAVAVIPYIIFKENNTVEVIRY